ncbi:hypothetical protein LSUE1_G003165 [Lachnellula suecica]|uniref:Uncharacterized protein n=1 Tax=Lachnellula suecica TaxID=602035 RepID=A0A8T9C6S1_9HELO|nr:hypothetical protein LSUE1_G003165 [Lachnellula suecica]
MNQPTPGAADAGSMLSESPREDVEIDQSPPAASDVDIIQLENLREDTDMDPSSPDASDPEIMSSENNYSEEVDDEDMDAALENPPPHEETHEYLGRMLTYEFPPPVEYEDDEQRDIFDDGLEDDDSSSSDSDVSTNYEDLDEPEIMARIIKIQAPPESESTEDDKIRDNLSDAWDSRSDSSGEPALSEMETAYANDQGSSDTAVPRSLEATPPLSVSFSQLDEQRHRTLRHPLGTLQSKSDRYRWSLLELEEQKKRIEDEILRTQKSLTEAEQQEQQAQEDFTSSLEASGISQELYDAYEAFCESLNPEFGQRGGFSVTCNTPPQGTCHSYVEYDPEFALFKEYVDIPYESCNFRCEAGRIGEDHFVEFWPIKAPEPLTGSEATWEEQYPELYYLAASAARKGSQAAMQMLTNLPDMKSSFEGGWLFDYQFEEALRTERILSRRWTFRSAHRINLPVTEKEKRQRVGLLIFLPEHNR